MSAAAGDGHDDVIAVDRRGHAVAVVSRADAHESPGVLHLAVSLQVITDDAGWIVQRRADSKALFAGRWANTCCTHPRPGEALVDATVRRAFDELGLVLDDVRRVGAFVYRARDPVTGLEEHEFDHVFVARAASPRIVSDPSEVAATEIIDIRDARRLFASVGAAPWALTVLNLAAREAVIHGWPA